MSSPCLIGSGAGFSGDRVDAAIPVVTEIAARGGGTIVFETIGERTLALAQLARASDPEAGYEPLLKQMLEPILSPSIAGKVNIVGNFGCANPRAAAEAIAEMASRQGLSAPRIAIVSGDNIYENFDLQSALPWPEDGALQSPPGPLISANAYTGAHAVAEAIRAGAQIVVAGRIADPALVLGPLMAHHGWLWDDLDRCAAGTLAGHLLECGSQISGGYFADPPRKKVPDMARIGFPIGEVDQDGSIEIFKAPGTGGRIDRATTIEQLLYEVHDPAAYVTPDVTLDITGVRIEEVSTNRVRVTGARGHARPDMLKATLGYQGDWIGEAEISYAGHGCVERARLAAEILSERFLIRNLGDLPRRIDMIGISSSFDDNSGSVWRAAESNVPEVRLRLAIRAPTKDKADMAVQEVLALYCCGPAGGGGVRSRVIRRVETRSCLVTRSSAEEKFTFL
jgi:hypothetical protein